MALYLSLKFNSQSSTEYRYGYYYNDISTSKYNINVIEISRIDRIQCHVSISISQSMYSIVMFQVCELNSNPGHRRGYS